MNDSATRPGEALTRRDLIEYLESGCKPRSAWRIGTEHEKFGHRLADHAPLPYDGPWGIRALLEGLQRYGWTPYLENGNPIALLKDGQSVTLEPGGQLELSGAPLHNLHRTCDEVHAHLDQVRTVSAELGIGFYGVGFRPDAPREAIPWMPKGRYKIMRRYMPTRGSLGLDMMTRTCTVQVNLDFDSEADMVRKMRVSMALQPIATALFANSPFVERKPSGFRSYRSHVWTDTDPDRCGLLSFVFEPGMGFERYADYVLDVPMYFVARGGGYIDVAGESFRDFLDGALPQLPRRTADDEGLGGSPDHGVPRGAPQDLHRDARNRQRAVGQDLLAAGALGRPALRFDRAQRGRGAHRLLVARRVLRHCTAPSPREALRCRRLAGGRRRTSRAMPWRSRPGA